MNDLPLGGPAKRVALAIAIVLAACNDTAEPRSQWTVAIVTDAVVPQFGDRLLVEVFPDGEVACAECRRQIPISAQTVWPVELGITPPPSARQSGSISLSSSR